ncbi:MAG: hypothetical protein MZV70_42710 [Desulfobacterales bacterium]|nr:hypothetical protein [Desulfobacterales bacterium]
MSAAGTTTTWPPRFNTSSARSSSRSSTWGSSRELSASLPGDGVQPAGDPAVRFDQQQFDPRRGGGRRHLLQVVCATTRAPRLLEAFDERPQARPEVRLDSGPRPHAQLLVRQRTRVNLDALVHQQRVVADLAERRVVLGQRGEYERHAGRPGVVLQNRPVNRTKESCLVDIDFVFLRPMAVAHAGPLGGPAVRRHGLMRLS